MCIHSVHVWLQKANSMTDYANKICYQGFHNAVAPFFHFSSLFGVWDMQQILLRDAIVNILHPTLIAAYSDTVSREPYNILKWPDL